MIPATVIDRLEDKLSAPVDKASIVPLVGGNINQVYRLAVGETHYCLKLNRADVCPDMLRKEETGLNRLLKAKAIPCVHPIFSGSTCSDQYLLLEFITTGIRVSHFWEAFGHQLATLHQTTHSTFGWEEDNYIGTLVQHNANATTWDSFYVNFRLETQVKIARDAQLLEKEDVVKFERFYQEIPSIYPQESPALLHGDLWSGNYLSNNEGLPVLIDPAPYYGHREMDLAMMDLFGDLDVQMMRAYNEVYPLVPRWEKRLSYSQLYPLLVHLNLFGKNYLRAIKTILHPF